MVRMGMAVDDLIFSDNPTAFSMMASLAWPASQVTLKFRFKDNKRSQHLSISA